MLKLVFWIAWLVLLLLLCVLLSPKKLLTPQFVFVGCFIPQAVFATYFVKAWSIDLSVETIFVLVVGTGLFFLTSLLFSRRNQLIESSWDFQNVGIAQMQSGDRFSNIIEVKRWKLVSSLLLQVVIFIAVIVYILNNIKGANLFVKIAAINNINKFGELDDRILLPAVLRWSRTFSVSSCYVFAYIISHGVVFKYKRQRILLVLNVVLGMLNCLTLGARVGIVGFIVSWIIETYIIWGKANQWRKRIKFKSLLIIVIICILVLLAFQPFLTLIGRNNNVELVDYLGVYISAPLKNLDTFVRNGAFGTDLSNSQTLWKLVDFLGRKLNIPSLVHRADLPFNQVNGKNIGNVYTIFYSYLYDGGYFALVFFVVLQCIISQISFRRALYGRQKHSINLWIIIYSYILQAIAFSFFGDRFYGSVLSVDIVQSLICWWLMATFLTRIRFHEKDETENELFAKRRYQRIA